MISLRGFLLLAGFALSNAITASLMLMKAGSQKSTKQPNDYDLPCLNPALPDIGVCRRDHANQLTILLQRVVICVAVKGYTHCEHNSGGHVIAYMEELIRHGASVCSPVWAQSGNNYLSLKDRLNKSWHRNKIPYDVIRLVDNSKCGSMWNDLANFIFGAPSV